jgi:uncharacterized protein (TIGR03437 family)
VTAQYDTVFASEVVVKILALFSFSVLLLGGTPGAQLFSHMPVRFEAVGEGRYRAHSASFSLELRPAESWLDSGGGRVRMTLDGANPRARMEPLDRLPGVTNYFLGGSGGWKTGVAGYGRVRSSGVYPGIDLIFHGEGGRLEYDFIVAPRTDPRAIRLEFSGQKRLRIDASGDLVITTASGEIRWKRPEIYQEVLGKRRSVDGRFVVSRGRVRFEVGSYDRSSELVIDPALAFSTFLGGNQNEGGRGIATDAGGNTYVVGNTSTPNLATSSGVFQPSFGGETAQYQNGDAFVAKFSPTGALVYLTYLGGSGDDTASAVAVDSAGNAYVTGCTTSMDFPIAGTPYQSTFGGSSGGQILVFGDAFVTKLNASGTKLIYSTYLGGGADDFGTAIAVDAAGDAYVTGGTRSANFPVTAGAYQTRLAGVGGQLIKTCCDLPLFDPGDAFVTELNPNGSGIIFSTFLGGSLDDVGFAIALDSSANVYVGGFTLSLNFPTSAGAYQTHFGGSEPDNEFFTFGDGFVSKLNRTGTALIYSTYFGGPGDDNVMGIAVDAAGNAYLTGSTSTPNWATPGAFQMTYGGYTEGSFEEANPYVEQLIGDAYAAKLNPAGTALIYFTYLGGAYNDGGSAIAIDSAGNAYITGFADSPNFPVTSNALQPKWAGDGGQPNGSYYLYGDAFLTIVNPSGSGLLYSSFFGGRYDDGALGLALDSSGGVHLTGITISPNFPTLNAAQAAYGGINSISGWAKGDAFVATFTGLVSLPPAITKVANAEGEGAIIAPNTWVEIKGTNLAPPTATSAACAPGYCWQSSDFVNNLLPTTLQGVSVTLNGEKAFVYFISPGQINILTPPDLQPGPVTVQVTNNGAVSASYTAQAQTVSESFFVINGGPYVVATHLNGNLIGPTSLYPGVTTPAQLNETIVIYANGFGTTTVPIVSGSETQSGSLPTMPTITIGGVKATVTFAGLISPGLYQFNVVVPSALPPGDNAIQASYSTGTTQSGTLLTIL